MARNGFEMVRHADDFVVLCANQQEAQKALEEINHWVEENGLKLHPLKHGSLTPAKEEGTTSLATILKGQRNGLARRAWLNSKTPYGARPDAIMEEV
jgi:hypothetical protein